jgi:membrane-associated protease RseP (regulator of RpoE activity)
VWPAARPSTGRPWINLVLLAATLVSTMAAGAMQQGVDPFAGLDSLIHLGEGIPFAGTLLLILAVHEFGHYFAARHWGVKASLPYFLPLPYLSFLGTLGAVIRLRSPIPHKRALLDIGAAGPLAGFAVAVVACVAGLSGSAVVEPSYFYQPPLQLGAPLLFQGLSALVLPQVHPNQVVLLNPVAFAGWVGLFITAFNLFPVGQLDGGHIAYALFDRGHRRIARLFFGILLGLGAYGILSIAWSWPHGWPGWLVLAFFLGLFGRDHPAPYDVSLPLDRRRRRVGYLCLLIFAVCFTPVPFSN